MNSLKLEIVIIAWTQNAIEGMTHTSNSLYSKQVVIYQLVLRRLIREDFCHHKSSFQIYQTNMMVGHYNPLPQNNTVVHLAEQHTKCGRKTTVINRK